MRIAHPLKQRGAVAERWDAWRKANALKAQARDRRLCVICGDAATDVHHTIGRKAEPWSSHHTLLCCLCRDHHAQVTGEPIYGLSSAFTNRLRMEAADRFEAVYGVAGRVAPDLYPIARIYWLIEQAEEFWMWDYTLGQLVPKP